MLGADVVDIERFRSMMERSPGLESRLFTTRELVYCRAKADPAQSFAGALAAKEAVIKALQLGTLPSWARRIEIVHNTSGAPSARVAGRRRAVQVSISHDGGVAFAVAIALQR